LKEEALDRTMWRNRFRGGFGPVVRQNTEWMNINWMYLLHGFNRDSQYYCWMSSDRLQHSGR